MFVFINNT